MSSQPSFVTASLSAERLSALEDESSRLITAPSRTASPSSSSTSLSTDQPLLSLAQVSMTDYLRVLQSSDIFVDSIITSASLITETYKIKKLQYLKKRLTNLMKFGMLMHFGPLHLPGHKNSRWQMTTISKIQKSRCIRNRLTDFDELGMVVHLGLPYPITQTHTHTHTYTHTTIVRHSWILFGTTRISRHPKGKTSKVKPIWIYWSKR